MTTIKTLKQIIDCYQKHRHTGKRIPEWMSQNAEDELFSIHLPNVVKKIEILLKQRKTAVVNWMQAETSYTSTFEELRYDIEQEIKELDKELEKFTETLDE